MAHINTVTLDGEVLDTKTSTHRSYVAATVLVSEDGNTAGVLVWHLTNEAAAKYSRSKAAADQASYRANKTGQAQVIKVLPVTVKLTGKDATQEAPMPTTLGGLTEWSTKTAPEATEDAPAIVLLNEAADQLLAQDDAYAPIVTDGSCRCGCGLPTAKTYRPGHDARHAAAVARDIASSSVSYFERVTADSDLGSQALINKAHAQAERLIAKMVKAAAKSAK